jgi:hypothetical protein
MNQVEFPFEFHEQTRAHLLGTLKLDAAIAYSSDPARPSAYRPGQVVLRDGKQVELVLVHSAATQGYIYLQKTPINDNLLRILGLQFESEPHPVEVTLPGQLIFGAERTRLIGRAVNDVLRAPPLAKTLRSFTQEQIIVVPILREGMKYQVGEALYDLYGYLCDEIVTDPHHVRDASVPDYGRRVVTDVFKDNDLTEEQRAQVRVAVVADSVASGIILFGLLSKISERYPKLERVEVVAPFVTLRAIARIRALWNYPFEIRVHAFETVLNALPPDNYYSAHYSNPELHFDAELERRYQAWWGFDANGRTIAETACAGYGWSEVFFNPRKQVSMINAELHKRNEGEISEIVEHSINAEFGYTVVRRIR